MSGVIDLYYSSIGKKVLMSLTGSFLILFLIEHLIGNLLLFANDNGVMYEAYGEFLVSNLIIRFIEIFLFLGMFGHATLGIILWIKNRKTRPIRYKFFRLKDNSPLASRTTLISGFVIGVFLYIHLKTFFFPLRFSIHKISSFELIVNAFSDGWYVLFYICALILLGYHLRHGFQSVFQTLGLRHKKIIRLLNSLAFIVWFLIPAGFASIPIYFYFFHHPAVAIFMRVN